MDLSERRPEMFVREFWRDTKRHDEIWAVEICDGHVFRCCGPFTEGEVDDDLLDTLDYSTARAAWIAERRDRFSKWEPPVSVIWPT
jgi:hypothetical protein